MKMEEENMAKRGGFLGGMPGNMNNLMEAGAENAASDGGCDKGNGGKVFTAAAGGGAVEVSVSGKKEVVAVKLSRGSG